MKKIKPNDFATIYVDEKNDVIVNLGEKEIVLDPNHAIFFGECLIVCGKKAKKSRDIINDN